MLNFYSLYLFLAKNTLMIQVIDRSLDILEFLGSDAETAKPLSEISERTGIKKTTCSNIMKTLLERGYVEQTGGRRDYKLGFKAYKLVGAPKFHEKLSALAHDALQTLYFDTAETVVLATIEGSKRVVIADIELTSGITARINHSNTIYRSATGRMILACYPKKKLDTTLDRIGLPDIADWPEVRTREQLYAALTRIKEQGIAVTDGNGEIMGIAVPLFKDGQVIASIGVCLPAFRYCGEKVSRIKIALGLAAKTIAKELEKGVM